MSLNGTLSFSRQSTWLRPLQPGANKQQSKSDRDKASKDFGVIVEVPGRPGHYCHAVDLAMEQKLKRENEASRRR